MSNNMNANKVEEILQKVKKNDIETVIVTGPETNGLMKGKFVSADMFSDMIKSNDFIKLSNVFFVTDPLEEQTIEPESDHKGYFPTKLNGYPDLLFKPDVNTYREVPWLEKTGLVIADFLDPNGDPISISPRHILQRVVNMAREMGFEPSIAYEYEFYLVPETAESLKQKNFTNIQSLSPRSYTYDVYRGVKDEEIIAPLRDSLNKFGIKIETSNTETGPGQFELNLGYKPALEAADEAFLYKNGVKQYAAKQGLIATFMAKPQQHWAGNSCHVHVSLWDKNKNVFWNEEKKGVSDILNNFTGGVLDTMCGFSSIFAPTINSYKRLVPYSWASTTVSWGDDNRSTGLRLVQEGAKKTRLEHRMPGGDSNPYLVAAAIIAGGLYGISQKIKPKPMYNGDAYADDKLEMVPGSLEESIKLFEDNAIAKKYFGEEFVNYYSIFKKNEVNAEKLAVTNWEIERYFELF